MRDAFAPVGHPVAGRPGRARQMPGRRSRPVSRLRRIAVVAALSTLVPGGISYLYAMTRPSNSSFAVRSVEWLRDQGGAGLVSQIESVYYRLTAPATGGPALRALPAGGYGLDPTAGIAGLAAAANRPPDIAALTSAALPGEGRWRASSPSLTGRPPVLLTSLRSDPRNYPRLVAGVAWIDPTRTKIQLYPGQLEPAVALPSRGPSEVPVADRGSLLATFNSGFKLSDAGGGFALGGRTYAPLQSGKGTIVGYADGRVDVLSWSGARTAPADVTFARQNLPLIVANGGPNPDLTDGPEWGATLGNAVRVWRSGVGVTAAGDLVYAAADAQTVASLADILIRAGAVRAMELDINSYWTTFISYAGPDAAGPTSLLPDMSRPASRYLTADDRDFFAVYLR